jgi:hypothetical protein
MLPLSQGAKTTLVVNPAAAGSTVPGGAGTQVDMAGFEGVQFAMIAQGSTAGVDTIKVQGSPTSTAWTDLSGATISTTANAGNKVTLLDVKLPQLGSSLKHFRYIRPFITWNSTKLHGGVIAQQYGARTLPVVQPTSTLGNSDSVAKFVVAPGT